MHTPKLSELIDIPRLQSLLDDFYTITTTPSAILDADGTVLTATGWQDICVQFHRANALCAERCQQSDAYITNHLQEGENYVAYECANGLVDVANPIMVAGSHIGTVFTGQFLFEEPDVDFFRQQAKDAGFDEAAYLEALAKVPVVAREKITPTLTYLSRFTEMLAEIGSERLKQKEAQEALQASEERFRLLMESIEDYAIIMLDRQGRVATWNSGAEHIKGYSEEEILGQHFSHFYPKEDVEQGKIELQLQEASEKGRFENENWLVRKDGSKFWANIILTALKDDAGNIRGFAKVTRDITQRKKIEEEQACLQEELLQAQQQTIYELSTPLIPLTEQVLVMPLVGVIDSSRAQQILETLLEGVANQQAEIAILDITGVQVVDTQVANAILQAAQAVKLLGAQVILTGISPVLAQTLVQLGADMRDIITCATLQVGIGYASRGRQSGRHKG